MRPSQRKPDELRPVRITRGYTRHAEGSVLVEFGDTKVICTASVVERQPPHLKGTSQGWVTAEYGMLPKSTKQRIPREKMKSGRVQEIQRLIGRSLRCVVDLDKLGEKTIYIDCDVIQADGGTRTASITGATVALVDALRFLQKNGLIQAWPMKELVSAISVGLIDGKTCLDLDYSEDSAADVDFNVVKTESGQYVEVQGTGEHKAFDLDQLMDILAMADKGIEELFKLQRQALEQA